MPPPPPADLPSPAVGLPSSNFPIYSQDSIDRESLDGKFSLLYPLAMATYAQCPGSNDSSS